jgi:ribose transport system substrate-binding protein
MTARQTAFRETLSYACGARWPRRRALALLLAAALPACRRAGRKLIGVVPQGRTHLFWQSIHAGAIAAARQADVDILWNAPSTETDYNGQLQIVDAMINQRVDALCLSPIDRKALAAYVERAVRRRIPVVIFDSGVESDLYSSWVATDNYDGGRIAAARIGAITGGKGKVAMLCGVPGVASTLAREQGFEDVLRERFPAIRIADKRFGYSDYARSLAIAENILTAIPDLDAIFAVNEGATVGAARALKSRRSSVRLVGFDFSPDLIAELESGLVDSLVAQDPFRIGYLSVESAAKAIRGLPVQKDLKLPARLIRKEDLQLPEIRELLNPDLKKYLG